MEKKFYLKPQFYIAIFYGIVLSYLGYKQRLAEESDTIGIAWSIAISIFGTIFFGVFISEVSEKLQGNDHYGWAGIFGLFALTIIFVAIVLFIPWSN